MPSKVKLPRITQKETDIRVGKEGLTTGVIVHIRKMLKRKKVLKIKFLPTAVKNKKELVRTLEEQVHCKIVYKVGFVVIIQRLQ